MKGCILVYLALSRVIEGGFVGFDLFNSRCAAAESTKEIRQIGGDAPRKYVIHMENDSDAPKVPMVVRVAIFAVIVAMIGCYICLDEPEPRSNSHIVEPECPPIARYEIIDDGNAHKQLRLACMQGMLAECFKELNSKMWCLDTPNAAKGFWPLFLAKKRGTSPFMNRFTSADKLMRHYPNMPELSNVKSERVKKIIEKLLNDRELAKAVSDALKSDEILYQIIMERKGTPEERSSTQFLLDELVQHGSSNVKSKFYVAPEATRALCKTISKRLQQLIRIMFERNAKEPAVLNEFFTLFDPSHVILHVMRKYYESDLNFDNDEDVKKRGSLLKDMFKISD